MDQSITQMPYCHAPISTVCMCFRMSKYEWKAFDRHNYGTNAILRVHCTGTYLKTCTLQLKCRYGTGMGELGGFFLVFEFSTMEQLSQLSHRLSARLGEQVVREAVTDVPPATEKECMPVSTPETATSITVARLPTPPASPPMADAVVPSNTTGPNGGTLVNVKLPVDGGASFPWEITTPIGKLRVLLHAPPGKNRGDTHDFEVFEVTQTRTIKVQLNVGPGEAFEHTVDGIPMEFIAPLDKKKGELADIVYPWPLDAPTADGTAPPLNAPGGGRWIYEAKYAGTATWSMCVVLCCVGGIFTCCGLPILQCPIDKRDEYHVLSPVGHDRMLVFSKSGGYLQSKYIKQTEVENRRISYADRVGRAPNKMVRM